MMNHKLVQFFLSMVFAMMSVHASAQMSRADGLYNDGLQLKRTFTVPSQQAAIQKFNQAQIAYVSVDKKKACQEQIAICQNNISRIEASERAPRQKEVISKALSQRVEIVEGAQPKVLFEEESLEIWHNRNLVDGNGMILHMNMEVQRMKGKKCLVMAFFYDENGRALKDKNQKYAFNGLVADTAHIVNAYEGARWQDFKLKMPYSELHLTGSGTKVVKVNIGIFDISGGKVKQLLLTPMTATSFDYDDTTLSVNGSEGEITQEYTEAGGRTTFKVSTNASDYKLVDVPSWCSIEKKTPTEFTLVCTPNESSNPRHYFFEVKASERKSQKITIVQAPASSASATINKVWAEEYAFFLTKGIRIHIDTKVNGLMNQDVYYSVLFYQADNKTPLMGKDGQQVTMSGSEFSEFDETHWSDWYVSIPYQYFPKDPDGGGRYTFDCIIKDAHGKELARSRNHPFSLP